ncbi:MGMT family protein [Thermostichus vulcanus]|uniref:MGMT family protein n=1 Tax=Thermostichus vulcanus str. 'Rupite' TaxID=2813851 RepID=A0ABT0CBM5_THEVL|nr:MGMT family protein [Thermostichus vulcanus str. 'Rupite']
MLPQGPSANLYQRFYDVVRRIPTGRVATYGQVARLAGYPGYARQVGYALFRLQGEETDIPWQRVINAQGRISYSPFRLGQDHLQKVLLEAEGIRFDSDHRVDLQCFGWDPASPDDKA